ncbi:hypothetical protein GGI12_002497 [Dipsacomyces acuminosporus]|nr:hypothetical protein GGI12_002497 [Dipsacomyces acuminosporus]
MTLTFSQIIGDLGSASSAKATPAGGDQPQQQTSQAPALGKDVFTSALDKSSLENIEQLVDSVRGIRAMTDQVMDARTRINESLENAKELDIIVHTHQSSSSSPPSSSQQQLQQQQQN